MGAGCSIDGPDTLPAGYHQQTIVAIRPKRESQPQTQTQPQPQQYGRRADEPPRTVALTRIWNSTTCGEMVKGQSLITLDQNETVLSASKLLDTKRISSAPVIDTKTQKPIAMFDYRDLTSFLIMANNHSMQQLADSGGFGVKTTTTGPDIKADQSTQRPEHHDSGSTSQQTWHSPSSLPGTPAQSTPRPDSDRSNASTPPPGTTSHVPRGSFAAKSGHNNPLLLISALKASTHAALDRTRSTEKQLQVDATTPKSEGIHKYLHFLDLKDALTGMVANLSGSNPLHTVSVVTPLYGAVQLMCGYNDVPVRALVVVNKTGNMMGMVSQSACLRFMYEKLNSPGAEKTMPSLVDFMKGSLRDLGLCNRRPPTISWKATVIQAFTYMNEKKKQSLAIINDENGVLVGTISISDIKYLWNSKELLLTLQRPVSVFVNVIRASATYWHVNLDSSSPATAMSTSYTAHTDQSLNDTINMMLTKRIHRVWLTNKQDKPVGILSMTDILRVLMPPPIEKVTKKNDHHTRALSHASTRPRQTSAPHTHHHPRIKVDTLHESKHTNVPSKYIMKEKDEYEDERMDNVPRRKSDGWTAGLAKT